MKKLLRFIFVFVVFMLIVVGIGSVYMFGVALNRKNSPEEAMDVTKLHFSNKDVNVWIDSLLQVSALHDTLILAEDGTPLHAWYIHSATGSSNTAIAIHGYTDRAPRMLMIGKIYSDMGYNVLLPDLRGHGQSGGKYIQMGWNDRIDIMKWIDVCKEMYGDTIQVALHGISMGAATAMMVAGEDMPENVKCVVEDCGYTSVWDEYKHELKKRYGLPAFPLLYTTSLFSKMKVGWGFEEASAINQIKNQTVPMLFIHGGNDNYVPTAMVYELFEAKPGVKELWVEEGVPHAKMYDMYTDAYIRRTTEFVDAHIKY